MCSTDGFEEDLKAQSEIRDFRKKALKRFIGNLVFNLAEKFNDEGHPM